MSDPAALCSAVPCSSCDTWLGLPGMRVLDVTDEGARLVVRVESVPDVADCPVCAVVAHAHGRDEVRLVDAPAFGRPIRLVWVKRRHTCPEPACAGGTFMEQDELAAAPRALLTTRAVAWAGLPTIDVAAAFVTAPASPRLQEPGTASPLTAEGQALWAATVHRALTAPAPGPSPTATPTPTAATRSATAQPSG